MFQNLGERTHFDTLDTLKKIKILISKSLGNLSFSLGGILEEFKKKETTLLESAISRTLLIQL